MQLASVPLVRSPQRVDRLLPSQRPDENPVGFQVWQSLVFLHWPMPVDVVARLLPEGLSVDTFEGRAYVGIVPFTMRDVRPSWSPSVPGISNFHELNVRTYVHARGRPGVWFFSLDAAGSIAVILARAGWHLPYYRAAMNLACIGDEIQYESRRLWPGPTPADFRLQCRVGRSMGTASPGTLEHFLVERYLLFADRDFDAWGKSPPASSGAFRTRRGSRLVVGQVHHKPYPLRAAEVLDVSESLTPACGLPKTSGEPHVLYSPGVEVEVFGLKAV